MILYTQPSLITCLGGQMHFDKCSQLDMYNSSDQIGHNMQDSQDIQGMSNCSVQLES